jgi:iron complex transport system substrate-binding protein
MSTPRVVSLVPSATEILRHLGVEPVGISHCCENLDSGAAVLTTSIVPDGLSQGEVDRFVTEAAAMGESLYRVNEVLLDRLRPDLLITQGVCDVCAVGSGEVERANACLPRAVPTVLLNGTRLDDLFGDMAAVGTAIGRDVSGEVAELRGRLAAVAAAVAARPPRKVAVVEWLEPPFLAGHWVPDMLTAAGGISLGVEPGLPSPRATWAQIAATGPELVLFSFCGYSLPRTLADLDDFSRSSLPGAAAFHALDAQYFCALTPKVVRGVEILAGLLHPEACPPPAAHESAPWHG